jgi:hypothetical protein
MGRPLLPLSLSFSEQEQLLAWNRRPKTAQALAMCARPVLLASKSMSNSAIAAQMATTKQTVGKWRQRYLDLGLDGLLDESRPGTSRKLGDKQG